MESDPISPEQVVYEIIDEAADKNKVGKGIRMRATAEANFTTHNGQHDTEYATFPRYKRDTVSFGARRKRQEELSGIESTLFDIDTAIETPGDIEPATPALLGLRAALVERRIGKIDSNTDESLRRLKTARYVGAIIARNKFNENYWKTHEHPDLLPPATPKDKRTAKRLERLAEKRFRYKTKQSVAEKRLDKTNLDSARYDRKIDKNREKHKKIVEKPKRKIEKQLAKKQRLLRKRAALELAQSSSTETAHR